MGNSNTFNTLKVLFAPVKAARGRELGGNLLPVDSLERVARVQEKVGAISGLQIPYSTDKSGKLEIKPRSSVRSRLWIPTNL